MPFDKKLFPVDKGKPPRREIPETPQHKWRIDLGLCNFLNRNETKPKEERNDGEQAEHERKFNGRILEWQFQKRLRRQARACGGICA